MDVSVLGQNPGSATALPTAAGGSPPETPRADGTAATAPPVVAYHAWFDLNGDGRIQDWPPMYGGDAIMTTPPAIGVRASANIHPPVREVDGSTRLVATRPVELRHARDAYARYGMTDAHRDRSNSRSEPSRRS